MDGSSVEVAEVEDTAVDTAVVAAGGNSAVGADLEVVAADGNLVEAVDMAAEAEDMAVAVEVRFLIFLNVVYYNDGDYI